MIALGRRSAAEATKLAVQTVDGPYGMSWWMSAGTDKALSPTIFLVEQPANSVVPPHFHMQNQFQLFIGGSGSIGDHALGPVVIHYAGAYTAYGPIAAGDKGLQYLTIRAVNDQGAILLADAKGRYPKGPKRGAQAGPLVPSNAWQLAALTQETVETVIPQADSGLAARRILLPPTAALTAIDPGEAQGTFIVVLSGSLHHGADELARWESIFVSADEAFPTLVGGRDGADVVALSTPRKSVHYAATDDAMRDLVVNGG
jgi:hypothetical protein